MIGKESVSTNSPNVSSPALRPDKTDRQHSTLLKSTHQVGERQHVKNK